MPEGRYNIDRNKSFEHLEHAPIIEAVVEIRCPSAVPWAEETIPDMVAKRLQGYQFLDSRTEYSQTVNIKKKVPISELVATVGWKGVRYRSDDEKYICAVNRDGFVFSRVGGYETWARFSAEASRVWEVHKSVAKPSDVHRIGLRYINRIRLPGGEVELDNFIYPGPQPPRDLPFPVASFLHKVSFQVPGHAYVISIVSAPSAGSEADYAIILDIDVYLQKIFEPDDRKIQGCLEDMRILKNEVFWGSLTPELLERLRGEKE